jgi:hypothetical protein
MGMMPLRRGWCGIKLTLHLNSVIPKFSEFYGKMKKSRLLTNAVDV